MKNKLKLEVNSKHVDVSLIKGTGLMITPILSDDYWMYRVKLSTRQSIVGFGKFGVVGIGFSQEDYDSNSNLSSGVEAEKIYNHIRRNKGETRIRKETCVKAIRMIQNAVHEKLKNKTIELLKTPDIEDVERLAILSIYLRQSNSWEVANMYDDRSDIKQAFHKFFR